MSPAAVEGVSLGTFFTFNPSQDETKDYYDLSSRLKEKVYWPGTIDFVYSLIEKKNDNYNIHQAEPCP